MCQHLLGSLQSHSSLLTAPLQLQLILHRSQGYRASKGKSQDLAPSASSAVVFQGPTAVLDLGMPPNHPKALLRQTPAHLRAQVQEARPGPENLCSERVPT